MGHHEGVLLGDHAAEFGDDARGHAHLQTDGVDVAAAGAAAGGQHHLVLAAIFDDFSEDRRQRLDPPVADGLATYFHYRHIRIKAFLGSDVKVVDKLLAHQALTHEPTFNMQPFAVLVPDQ